MARATGLVDSGEKLWGSRKDRAAAHAAMCDDGGEERPEVDAEEAIPGRELPATRAALWPRPDFAGLARAGMDVTHALRFMVLYDHGLSARPHSLRRDSPLRCQKAYRVIVAALREAFEGDVRPYSDADLRTQLLAKLGAAFIHASEYELERLLTVAGNRPHAISNRNMPESPLRTPRWTRWLLACHASLGWPHDPRIRDDDVFGIGQYASGENRWVALSVDRHGWEQPIGKPQPSPELAWSVARAVFEQLHAHRVVEDQRVRGARIPERPQPVGGARRMGPDLRARGSISPSSLMDDCGFRGIEFGNWVPQAERQRWLDDSHDALVDLTELMGVPLECASLGGRLGLAFGSRGFGRRTGAAHFERGADVMHFTRAYGAGALAHEFGHALDAHLFDCNWEPETVSLRGPRGEKGGYLSTVAIVTNAQKDHAISVRGDGMRLLELADPVSTLWRFACGSAGYDRWWVRGPAYRGEDVSQFVRNAMALDGFRRKRYWAEPTEMFARLFECWVSDRLQDRGTRNDFLVYAASRDAESAPWDLPFNPYPFGEERVALMGLMDSVVTAIARALPSARRIAPADEAIPSAA